jgi:hypothetical protein
MASFAQTISGWRDRPDLRLASLGLLSGALSATVGFDLELSWLKPVAAVFFLDAGPLPIGIFFAAAVAIGLWSWTGNVWTLPALMVTTIYAWSAAIQVAIRLQRTADDDLHLIAASLCAGAVGAGLTHLGCAPFASEQGRPARVAVTCAVGAAAGMLLFLGQRKFVDERLLFLVWQPAVAFSIGMGLAGRNRET